LDTVYSIQITAIFRFVAHVIGLRSYVKGFQ
jgi:hypothetical protein